MLWVALTLAVLALLFVGLSFWAVGVQASLQGRGDPDGNWMLGGGASAGPILRRSPRLTLTVSAAAARGVPGRVQLHIWGRRVWQRSFDDLLKPSEKKDEEEPEEESSLIDRYERFERWLDPVDLAAFLLSERRRIHIDTLRVDAKYSFADVATTGKVLGALSVLGGVLPPPVIIHQQPSWDARDDASLGILVELWFRPGLLAWDVLNYLVRNVKLRRRSSQPEALPEGSEEVGAKS